MRADGRFENCAISRRRAATRARLMDDQTVNVRDVNRGKKGPQQAAKDGRFSLRNPFQIRLIRR